MAVDWTKGIEPLLSPLADWTMPESATLVTSGSSPAWCRMSSVSIHATDSVVKSTFCAWFSTSSRKWLQIQAQSSADAAGPELDADARAGRPGCLGDGVFPGALAAAAHDDQVAVA